MDNFLLKTFRTGFWVAYTGLRLLYSVSGDGSCLDLGFCKPSVSLANFLYPHLRQGSCLVSIHHVFWGGIEPYWGPTSIPLTTGSLFVKMRSTILQDYPCLYRVGSSTCWLKKAWCIVDAFHKRHCSIWYAITWLNILPLDVRKIHISLFYTWKKAKVEAWIRLLINTSTKVFHNFLIFQR